VWRKEYKEKHERIVMSLLKSGVSWWRIVHNDLDDPRLSEAERMELVNTR
jgi:hypothetical protein